MSPNDNEACWNEPPFGAIVQVTLRKPVSVDGIFPMWDYRDGTHTRYFTGTLRIRASGVRTIGVIVDVTRSRVVAVDPTFGDGAHIRFWKVVEAFHPGPHAGC